MSDLDRFKSRVAEFIDRTGISRRDMGKCACNDGSFVFDLEDGREPRFSTIEKVDSWMDLYERDPDAALGRKVSSPAEPRAA